ncbi:MAG: MerR family transcriptional regulator [Chloroflexota bacterium]
MVHFSIGQIAARAGINASAIRYYERIGLLPACERVSGKRVYDESILEKLKLIHMAKSAGLSIEEIQTLVNDFPDNMSPSTRWKTLATRKVIEMEQRIAAIQAMKAVLEKTLDCACSSLDECGRVLSTSRS